MEDPITSGLSGLADAQPPDPSAPASPMPNLSTPGTAPQAAPTQQQPTPAVSPNTPHAGLMSMIQGMMLGVSAFGKSIATQGREGGAEEVLSERRAQQEMKLKQDANTRAQQESAANITHLQALTNMQTAQLSVLQMKLPLELQKMQNDVFSSEVNAMKEAGFSPLEISMIEGQSTDEHLAGATKLANGDWVNNAAIPVHSNQGIGKGGTTYITPFQKMQQITLPSDKLSMMLRPLQMQLETASATGLGDRPEVKAAQNIVDSVAKQAADGGTMKLSDFHNLALRVMTPVSQATTQRQEIMNFQKEKLANEAAARPKDLNDAVGRLTQAQQAYKTAPTPANQLGVTAAQTAVNVFQREEAKAAAQKSYATKSAELNAMDVNDAKNAPTLIDAAKNYQLDPEKLFGLRGQQRANFMAGLLKEDPTWNMATYKAKFNTVQDFSPAGKVGEQVRALNTFAGHAADALDLVDTLRNNGSPLINAPMNKVAQALGNDKIGPFNAAMMAAKEEYQNFLKAGHAATKEETERIEKLGSANSSPAVNEAILKQMAQTVQIRAGSLNSSYKSTMGKDFPAMFSPEGAAAMAKLGHPVTKFGVAGQAPTQSTFDPKTDFKPIQPQATQ